MKDDFIIEFKNAYPDELCDEFINEWVTPTYHLMSEMHPNVSMDDHLKNKSSQDMYFVLGGHRGVRHGCGAHDILNDKYQAIMKNVKEKYIATSENTNFYKSQYLDVIIIYAIWTK